MVKFWLAAIKLYYSVNGVDIKAIWISVGPMYTKWTQIINCRRKTETSIKKKKKERSMGILLDSQSAIRSSDFSSVPIG